MINKREKILYVITKSNWGGAQRYVFDLATSLDTETFEPVVALGGTGLPRAPLGALAEKLTQSSVNVIQIKSFIRNISIISDMRSFFELVSIYRKEKPDVIHLNSSKAGGVGALAGRVCGIKKILFTAHGFAFNEKRILPARLLIRLLSWATMTLATHTITITKNEYEQVSQWIGLKNKISYIQNGISAPTFLPKKEARVFLSSRIGKPDDYFSNKRIVGTIAELTPNKGIIEAIDAIARTDYTYIVIGNGELHEEITEYIRSKNLHEKIFLTGFINNASQYLSAFDTFILPSLKEGLPYVLLEAGYAKLPTVARNIGGIPDLIQNNVSGVLFSKNEEIASALIRVNETHGSALFAHVSRSCTKERMCEDTTAHY